MTTMIIDNFLPYPNVVRSWAIQQDFFTSKEFVSMYGSHTDWPGKRTLHVVELDHSYADVILTQIASIASKHYGLSNVSIRSYFQLTTEQDGDSWVHQDNDTDLAAILYLNPDPPDNSGTTLYQCTNQRKWESFMSDSVGYNTLKTINSKENVDLYKDLFKPTDVIGNIFNRLIFYPGIAFHKSNNYFGSSIEDGRLTQVFFIKQDNG